MSIKPTTVALAIVIIASTFFISGASAARREHGKPLSRHIQAFLRHRGSDLAASESCRPYRDCGTAIVEIAKRHQVDPLLVIGIAGVESGVAAPGQFCAHDAWGYRAADGGYCLFESWTEGITAEVVLLEHYHGLPWSYAEAQRYCACASPSRWQAGVQWYMRQP